jgi:hypothetical protein
MRAKSYVGQAVLECDVWGGFENVDSTDGLLARRSLSEPVPEGLSDRSQAIYCLEQVQSRIRPVLSAIARMATEEGHGLILTPG